MNDPVLKLKMAKLLPEKIQIDNDWFYWKEGVRDRSATLSILETEWLYVMQLVEQTLSDNEHGLYVGFLIDETCCKEASNEWNRNRIRCDNRRAFCSATFNQRATAMLKVKEIAAVEVPPTTAANQSSTIPYGEKESR